MTSQNVIKRSDALKQCIAIRAEIKQLEQEITKLKSTPWEYSVDCVFGSSLHEPYQQHPITVGSYNPTSRVTIGVNSRLHQISKFHEKLVKSQCRAEDFLQTIPDAMERVILRSYYIEGKEWQEVAAELTESTGKDFTEAAVKMRAKRFFEKN